MSPEDAGARVPKVVTVVVAYNREELLRQTLDGLASQRVAPAGVVVIDNASTDGSAGVARTHPAVTEVVTLPENTGGAGGFAAGIARAVVTHAADLVWVMDDDTVPGQGALEALLQAREDYPGTPAILASRAEWHDGREHPMNVPRERPGISRELRETAFRLGVRQIRSASFVSILIDARAVWEDGLPLADYFLWNDDFEYTARLLRRRVGLYVPASRVTHLTRVFGNAGTDPGPRFYNEVRNKIWMMTRSPALDVGDRVAYSGATLLRWAKLLVRSQDRGSLVGHAARGMQAGVKQPRTTVEVLTGTPVEEDVRTVEEAAGRG